MEKDPEIVVITALLCILELEEWKSLTPDAQSRCLTYFNDRKSAKTLPKEPKSTPPEQVIYRKYEDLLDMSELKKLADEISPKVFGPGKDDYGRKPRPLDITCQGGRALDTTNQSLRWQKPLSALTMTSSTSFSNNPIGLSSMEDP